MLILTDVVQPHGQKELKLIQDSFLSGTIPLHGLNLETLTCSIEKEVGDEVMLECEWPIPTHNYETSLVSLRSDATLSEVSQAYLRATKKNNDIFLRIFAHRKTTMENLGVAFPSPRFGSKNSTENRTQKGKLPMEMDPMPQVEFPVATASKKYNMKFKLRVEKPKPQKKAPSVSFASAVSRAASPVVNGIPNTKECAPLCDTREFPALGEGPNLANKPKSMESKSKKQKKPQALSQGEKLEVEEPEEDSDWSDSENTGSEWHRNHSKLVIRSVSEVSKLVDPLQGDHEAPSDTVTIFADMST